MRLLVPAVIPASYRELMDRLAYFDQIPARRVQVDFVDGVFATPASWPYNTEGSDLRNHIGQGIFLPRLDRVKYEADLLCKDPEKIAPELINFGFVRLTLHAECTDDISGLIARMRHLVGAEANFIAALVSIGLSINIDTPVDVLLKHAEEVEYVQFMGVDTVGRQGEPFNPIVLEKVRAYRRAHPEAYIQVDGGVSLENAKDLVEAGVSRVIVGSAINHAPDLAKTAAAFEALKTPFGV
ncbi:MAG: HisA/HisF-related TIM barrel protein [Candidatus Paceibacterota bacterium]